ncbi:MAG: hypothetical protein IPK84_04820 [Candidatus Moraniibacteriota bacterium]|nr:MAG: hypothetical protein IPK84_04820 [Candidatus Moranbacteria bacterium]
MDLLFLLSGLYLFIAGILSWALFFITRESPREFLLLNAKKWILWFFIIIFLPFPVYNFLCGGFLPIGENILESISEVEGESIQSWIFFLSTSVAYLVLSYASAGFVYSMLRRVSKRDEAAWISISSACVLMVIIYLSTFRSVSC